MNTPNNIIAPGFGHRHLSVNINGALEENANIPEGKRALINAREMATLICVVSGVSPSEIDDFRMKTAIAWLIQYIEEPNPDTKWKNDWVEGDVYRLLTNPIIIGWWLNNWYRVDVRMIQTLIDNYRRNLNVYAYMSSPQEARKKAQEAAWQQYISTHALCLDARMKEYRKLEDSYAVIIKHIR